MFKFGFDLLHRHDVIPAKAGIHLFFAREMAEWRWIPAFAGTTPWYWHRQAESRASAYRTKPAIRPLASV
jgi:hypothetical protein